MNWLDLIYVMAMKYTTLLYCLSFDGILMTRISSPKGLYWVDIDNPFNMACAFLLNMIVFNVVFSIVTKPNAIVLALNCWSTSGVNWLLFCIRFTVDKMPIIFLFLGEVEDATVPINSRIWSGVQPCFVFLHWTRMSVLLNHWPLRSMPRSLFPPTCSKFIPAVVANVSKVCSSNKVPRYTVEVMSLSVCSKNDDRFFLLDICRLMVCRIIIVRGKEFG